MSILETRIDTPSIRHTYPISGFAAHCTLDLESKLGDYRNATEDRDHDRLHTTVLYIDKHGQACSVDVDITEVERMGPFPKFTFWGDHANHGWSVEVTYDFANGEGILELSA